MTGETIKHAVLAAGFLATIGSVAPVQLGVELAGRQRPGILELFRKAPTEANLRALEKQLDDACWLSARIRPWMQYWQYAVLGDCGDKAVEGRDAWFFYKPEVQYAIETWPPAGKSHTTADDPLAAIVSFRDQLKARGIGLLVVPAPNKVSAYPEMLAGGGSSSGEPANPHTRELLARLQAAGIDVVDLFVLFARVKPRLQDPPLLYLAQDTHWSPVGMRLAAREVARRVLDLGIVRRGGVEYEFKPVPVRRQGDVLRMMQIPKLASQFPAEEIDAMQVVRSDSKTPYRDDPASPILVLGDSFLRIYERDEPRSAGFIAHLARELGFPLASVVNDGGASTLVRQELYRRPELLAGKKLVIWEFVERDIRFGTEGWQEITLPAQAKAGGKGR